mmetsp:Transcript_12835/g.32875  ORF Transcript_12835/g.32875 Transcript_12835/m.32875 type:complete len:241 (-) Transcript_12835:182-904(-)
MLASFATISASTLQECASDLHAISGNPVKECLEPVVSQVMQYLTDVTLAAASMVGSTATTAVSSDDDGHLWYRAPDFERFKEDVINEAKRAGCKCPESQYHHIRSKYLDDVTMRNTALNLQRSSFDATPSEPMAMPFTTASRRMSAPCTIGAAATAAAATPPHPRDKSKSRRKGHRRSVSWSKELQQVAQSRAHERRSVDRGDRVSATKPTASQPRLSPRDEAARILDEEDSAELREIFL